MQIYINICTVTINTCITIDLGFPAYSLPVSVAKLIFDYSTRIQLYYTLFVIIETKSELKYNRTVFMIH